MRKEGAGGDGKVSEQSQFAHGGSSVSRWHVVTYDQPGAESSRKNKPNFRPAAWGVAGDERIVVSGGWRVKTESLSIQNPRSKIQNRVGVGDGLRCLSRR